MSQAAPSRESDRQMDGLIFIGVAAITVWLIVWMMWRYQQDTIMALLFWSVGYLSKVIQYAPFLFPSEIGDRLGNWSVALHLADPGRFGWPTASLLIQTITHTLTLIFVPLILLRVRSVRRYHVITKFTRRFNLDKLKARNASKYAQVASVQHENPLLMPVHEGAWAMARSPIDYALENQLIVTRKRRVATAILQSAGIRQVDGNKDAPIKGWNTKKMRWSVEERREWMPPPASCRLDVPACDALCRSQLLGLWSTDKLDRFERCVLAILLVANVEGLGKARELALRLALSFKRLDKRGKHNPTINDKGIDKIIQNHLNSPIVKTVLKKHAFRATVFMGLLESAWKRGIFISSEFLWFKTTNRGLYLALNCLGGDRPFAEAAGPWAHYMVEQKKGAKISTPCIEGGTDSIKHNLFEEMWIGSDDGTVQEIAERTAIDGASDDTYSPTRGVDLFDPPKPH